MEAGGKKIIVASEEMKTVMSQAEKVLDNDFILLLLGESGAGKEVVARYIHEHGARAAGPFIPVNCGAIPETLFESEFFGHERGAYTHAFATHKGYFEQANNGTIFLDEICELPVAMQVKLLRVLENEYIVRIGGEKEIPIDVRVMAASNRDIYTLMREGKFRQDLYYRLVVYPIWIPPLRERKEDIQALAEYFLRKNGGDGKVLSAEALRKLYAYNWPGNVRELDSCIWRAIVDSGGKELIVAEDIQLNGVILNDRDSVALGAPSKSDFISSVENTVDIFLKIYDSKIQKVVAEIDALRKNSQEIGAAFDKLLCSHVAGLNLEKHLLGIMKDKLWEKVIQRVGGNRKSISRLMGVSLRTVDHNSKYKMRQYTMS